MTSQGGSRRNRASGSPPNTVPGTLLRCPRIRLGELSIVHGTGKQVDVVRLQADLAAAGVELLSAHCAADRVRLQYSPQDIVAYGDRHVLRRAITSAQALYLFFSQIEAQINHQEDANP